MPDPLHVGVVGLESPNAFGAQMGGKDGSRDGCTSHYVRAGMN